MLVREAKPEPPSWAAYAAPIRHGWTRPFHAIEWACQWTAFFLSRWAFLEMLEYLSTLSVLFAVIFYYSEAGDRLKQKHYQAWQVINTAQGKGGNGGRIEALQELNADGIPLVGVDVSGAFLRGVQLRRASLLRASIDAADLRDCILTGSDLSYASLKSANLRNGDLTGAKLRDADLEDADLSGATLAGADLTRANLKNADLQDADLRGIEWRGIRAVDAANLYGVRNAPDGFVAWALQHGAVSIPDRNE